MKILIVAGGTGGHLFPAIRLAEEIRERQVGDVLFITSSRIEDQLILKDKNILFHTIPVVGFQSKSIIFLFNFTVRLIAGTVRAGFLLLHFKPAVVIGFGGYISGPVLLMAALSKIKAIIHEQNVYPGKTNIILANFVDKIAISFPETIKYLKKFESKVIISGSPLRRGLKRIEKSGDKFTVLAMGGSQGAHILNKLVPEAVGLMQEERKKALEIIHISGYKEKEDVMRSYQEKGIRNRVFSFTDEIHEFYNESDFVVARAGATSVAELLYLAKPCILIPYPHRGAHQYFNAKVLEDKGLGVIFEEKNFTAEVLRYAMLRLMDREVLRSMSQRAQDVERIDACEVLINMITQISGNSIL